MWLGPCASLKARREGSVRPAAVVALATVLAAATGCGRDAGNVVGDDAAHGFGLVFPSAGSSCSTNPAGLHRLPADVEWLVARVLDPKTGLEAQNALQQPAVITLGSTQLDAGAGEVLLGGLVPGTYKLEVTGCSSGGKATWRGEASPVEVVDSGKASPVLFMLPAGRVACVGGKNLNPLVPAFDGEGFLFDGRSAFGASVLTAAGRVIVAGGGGDGADFKSSPDVLTAGNGLWEFDRGTGVFLKVYAPDGTRLTLAEPRMMHGLVALSEDALLAIGGAKAAELGPSKFPGAYPPLLIAKNDGVTAPLELITLSTGTAKAVKKVASTGRLAAWAYDAKHARVALAGGAAAGGDATPSKAVEFVKADPASLAGDAPEVVSGTLAAARFGAVARFVSTGDLLLVGGWDGSKAAGQEVVWLEGGKSLVAQAITVTWPSGVTAAPATAFAQVEVLVDDGTQVRLLVFGGNPLADGFGYKNPDKANAWTLTLPVKDGHVEPASGAGALVDIAGEWPARALAAVVPFAGERLLAGGYRSYSQLADVADCKNSSEIPLNYCFPRSLAVFGWDGKAPSDVETVGLEAGRFGATVVGLDARGDTVLVLGGLAGFGANEPSDTDWTEPAAWQTSQDWMLSTGVVAVRGDLFDSDVCTQHPAPVATP